MRGYARGKDDYLKRSRRIEGQVHGLARMTEEDEYCIDILTQVSAATKGLQAASIGLLDAHRKHCVAAAMTEGGEDAEAKSRKPTTRSPASFGRSGRPPTWCGYYDGRGSGSPNGSVTKPLPTYRRAAFWGERTLHRPGLQRAREAIRAGPLQVLLVDHVHNLSRAPCPRSPIAGYCDAPPQLDQ